MDPKRWNIVGSNKTSEAETKIDSDAIIESTINHERPEIELLNYGVGIRTMRLQDGKVVERFESEESSSSQTNRGEQKNLGFPDPKKVVLNFMSPEGSLGASKVDQEIRRIYEKVDKTFYGTLNRNYLMVLFVIYYTLLFLVYNWIPI